MLFYGTDPSAEENFYFFTGYADDSLMAEPGEIYFTDDRLIVGPVHGIDTRFVYQAKDVTQVAKLELYSLTEPAYKFYNSAYAQIHTDGGFFSTPPANIPSMFDNGALGIFQCSIIQRLYTTVPKK